MTYCKANWSINGGNNNLLLGIRHEALPRYKIEHGELGLSVYIWKVELDYTKFEIKIFYCGMFHFKNSGSIVQRLSVNKITSQLVKKFRYVYRNRKVLYWVFDPVLSEMNKSHYILIIILSPCLHFSHRFPSDLLIEFVMHSHLHCVFCIYYPSHPP